MYAPFLMKRMNIKSWPILLLQWFRQWKSPFQRSVYCAKSTFQAVIVGYRVQNQPKTYHFEIKFHPLTYLLFDENNAISIYICHKLLIL